VWIGILESKPIGLWFIASDSISLNYFMDGSPIDRAIFFGLMLAAVAVLAKRPAVRAVFSANRWLIAFYAFWLVSVLWSDYSLVSLRKWFRESGNLLMILIILTEDDPIVAIRQVFVRCGLFLIPISVLLIKYYVEIGRYYNEWNGETAWRGVTDGKNQLGRLALITGLFLIWKVLLSSGKAVRLVTRIRKSVPELMVLAMCLWILRTANSATSIATFFVGVSTLVVARLAWTRRHPGFVAFLICCFLLTSLFFLTVPDLRALVTNRLGRSTDLTQRTDVWEGCFKLETNPLIGAGFSSVWMTRKGVELANQLKVGEAHNGYLETYLNGGLLGVGLLLGLLLSGARSVLRYLASNWADGALYASIFLTGIIYNYTESTFNNGNVVGLLMWLVMIQCSVVQQQTGRMVPVQVGLDETPNECLDGPEAASV
jgi:O-antigen ligase